MAIYKYVGRTESGSLKRGTIEEDSRQAAIQRLRAQGISPRELKETKPSKSNQDISLRANHVKSEDFVIYCRQFATLIRAGITIVDATNILSKQTESKVLKQTLQKVEMEIRGGIAFSDAVEKYPKIFPPLFSNMVRAGEMTGSLDDTLDRLADYFEKQHALKKNIQSTMAYPTILTILIIAVVTFLLVYIIPQFMVIYDQFDSELPVITQIIISISEVAQEWWWILLLTLTLLIGIFVFLYKTNRSFHYSVHVMILRMPIFGELLQKTQIARMTRTLSSLFSSAVPILDALEIVAKVVENPVISKVVLEARRNLEKGGSLSEPLASHWVFPPLVYQMIAIGEKTGTLDYMLEKIADFYEQDVDRSVATLKSLIEPLMIVLLAFVVGFIVLSVMVPMFQVFTEIQ